MIARFLAPILRDSSKSILLLGPRQVGKSTLIESLKPDLEINLALPSEYLRFSNNPDELLDRIEQIKPKTVFLDEIQRLPDLLNVVQVLIDRSKGGIKFLLSGSSARKLKRGNANLLPGRILSYRLAPLSVLELGYEVDQERALELGFLPEPHLMAKRAEAEKLLQTYAGTYLQEEILSESLTRQIQGFSRFLGVVAANSGLFLDFSKVAARAKVDRSAARRYYEIMEDTLICERCEAFEGEGLDLVRHPKYYLFDIGVVNGVLNNFRASPDRVGLLFEHVFFNQLRNTAFALDRPIKISHLRTRGGFEVDFIIEVQGRIIAVELKASEPVPSEIARLSRVTELVPRVREKYIACLKTPAKKTAGVSVLPWLRVLREIFG